MDYISLAFGIFIGCFLGGIAVFAFFGRKTDGDVNIDNIRLKTQLDEKEKYLTKMEEQLRETFAAISQEAIKKNSESFLQTAKLQFAPFEKLLEETKTHVRDLELKREKAYTNLESATKDIIEETSKLENALRRPDHRGKWGEVGLRNVVEFAGMTDKCDFEEQVSTSGDRSYRPDMVIKMPGGGRLVVDSKLPLDHYLSALEHPEAERAEHLDNHVKALETHINSLASKAYWEQFDYSPAFVVMFVNVESALVAALERNPDLHNKALSKKVLLTSPTTLIALLQAAAFGWRQDSMAKNAEEIAKAGQELYDRLSIFQEHLAKVGNRLHQATESYNKAVGSFTTRLEPGAKRLSELHSTGGKELPPTEPIDIEPRAIE
ncbi:MAG: DNA recombination protein RmuC [Phycisphaerales bacterium]|nr:DNA recombination protein RmuC [Phycisphaerales bacterium]